MRRALLGLIAAAALILAGCGSSSSGAPSNPFASELSYFPSGSPFVLSIQTASKSETPTAIASLEKKLPQVNLLRAALLSKLQQFGISYDKDIHPLLGNPAMFGDASTSFSGFGQHFLVVWVTHDASTLSALVHKFHGVHQTGSHSGTKIYSGSGAVLGINGPTLLLTRTQSDLLAALARHQQNQGITSAEFASATSGLDPNAVVRIFGNVTRALSAPSAATARKIPWVAALRSYALALGTNTSGVTMGFRLNTDSSSLSPGQLPIASGTGAPGLVTGLPIQVGIRDPAQIVTFAEGAAQAASPNGWAKFQRQEGTLKRKTGVDVQKLFGDLSGDLVVDSDTRTTLARVGLSNPADVKNALSKLAAAPGGLGHGKHLKPVGGGAYSIPDTGRAIVMGVIGDQFVLGVPAKGATMRVSTLKSFASAPSAPAAGAGGAVSFRIALGELIALASKSTPSPFARQILGLLGDVTGSMSATTGALSGTATLSLK